MTATARAAETSEPVQQTEKLYMENTLLRVAGALFCHDAKRAPTHTEQIELNRGVAEKNIVIRPDPKLGQPGPLAHKIFVALIKKHSGYGRPTQADVSFTKRELMRLIGRAEWGGSASEQLARALDEIHYTFVRTRFKSADKFVEHSFNIFPEIYLERREHATDPIEACTVTLARPIMASLQDGHFTCLNHGLMQQLGTIGQAFYMRLFFHFANLYDGHHQKRVTFAKRYDDICAEWLGGLDGSPISIHHRARPAGAAPAPAREGRVSRVLHHHRSQRPGRLRHHLSARRSILRRLRPLLSAPGAGKCSVRFSRRPAANRRAAQGRVSLCRKAQRPAKRRHPVRAVQGRGDRQVPFSSASVCGHPGFSRLRARRGQEDPLRRADLGRAQAISVPLPGTARRSGPRTKASQARREAEDKATQRRMDYDRFRRAEADRLFSSLPAKERAAIEAAARAKAPRFGRGSGSLAQTMFEIERARITAERHPRKIPSFEQWQRRNA